MPLINSKREVAVAAMIAQLNNPYIWGGNSPLQDEGGDCSGSIRFALDEAQVIPHGSDYTSWQFADMFTETDAMREGVLVFFKNGGASRINHVEMVLGWVDGEWWTIGATGGDRSTRTLEDAQKRDARVKMHPMPSGRVKAVDPFGGGR